MMRLDPGCGVEPAKLQAIKVKVISKTLATDWNCRRYRLDIYSLDLSRIAGSVTPGDFCAFDCSMAGR